MLTRRGSLDLPLALDEINTQPAFRQHFEDGLGRPSLERLERFLEVRSVRQSIRAQLRRSNSSLSTLGLVVLLISLGNFCLELRRTLGRDPPRLDNPTLAALNAPKPVDDYFGDLPTQPRGHARVVLLVVSGLRRDALDVVPGWQRLMATDEFRRDALTLALRAGPPSTSTSQWLALATGASAAITGVYGDQRLAEPPFDSIFRQARLHGLSSFATGSPWFTELFHSQLLRPHRFFAEGAVPPTYGTWAGWPQPPSYDLPNGDGFLAGDEADKQRLTLLHRALLATAPPPSLAQKFVAESAAEAAGTRGSLMKLTSPGRGVLSPDGALADDDPSRAPVHVTSSLEGHGPAQHLFELLACQLSEADVQSHCSGAAPVVDPRATYVASLSTAADRISELVGELDATTTLLIVSDHGSVDSGGSGGSEPLSVDVPLIAYRAGSQLSSLASDHPLPPLGVRRNTGWRTVDVAPTICALLGLPVPRESEGVPIEPLLTLANQPTRALGDKDLFVQRQRLLRALAAQTGTSLSHAESVLLSRDAPTEAADVHASLASLIDAHASILARSAHDDTTLATWITALISLALLALYINLVQRSSFADLSLAWGPVPGQYANRRAFTFALLGVISFYALATALFTCLLRLRGYANWDSTVLHFPTELLVYLLDATLPALLMAYILTRSFHFPFQVTARDTPDLDDDAESDVDETPREAPSPRRYDDDDDDNYSKYSDDDDATRRSHEADSARAAKPPPRGPRWTPLSSLLRRGTAVLVEYLRCLCLGHAPVYSDLSIIYLIKVYVLGFAIASLLLLSTLQASVYTFWLPQLLVVHFDVEADWTYRFQLLTLQLVSLCLLAVAVVSMRVWPAPDLSAAHFDKLYSLVLLKWERRQGASAKSDDVLAMLEEETEALIQAGYGPILQGEPTADD